MSLNNDVLDTALHFQTVAPYMPARQADQIERQLNDHVASMDRHEFGQEEGEAFYFLAGELKRLAQRLRDIPDLSERAEIEGESAPICYFNSAGTGYFFVIETSDVGGEPRLRGAAFTAGKEGYTIQEVTLRQLHIAGFMLDTHFEPRTVAHCLEDTGTILPLAS